MVARRDERRAAAGEARLPGPARRAGPLRLRVRDEVAVGDRAPRLDEFDGYWIPRGWSKDGPIKTQSRIDVPAESHVDGGPADDRRRRVGADPRHRARRGADRRRPVAGGDARRRRSTSTRGGSGSSAGTPRRASTRSRFARRTGRATRRPPSETRADPDGATGHHTIEVTCRVTFTVTSQLD